MNHCNMREKKKQQQQQVLQVDHLHHAFIESFLVLRRPSVDSGARAVMGLSLLKKQNCFLPFIDKIQRRV